MINYTLPTSIELDGTSFEIRSDFRAILDIISALNDANLEDADKIYIALKIFYKSLEDIKDIKEAYEKLVWFIDCGEDFKNYNQKPRLMDWEQDFSYIAPAVNKTLGYECRSINYLHWWSFIGAYREIGECSFSYIVGIRNKVLKGERLDKQERKFYNENIDLIKLKDNLSDEEKELIDSII